MDKFIVNSLLKFNFTYGIINKNVAQTNEPNATINKNVAQTNEPNATQKEIMYETKNKRRIKAIS